MRNKPLFLLLLPLVLAAAIWRGPATEPVPPPSPGPVVQIIPPTRSQALVEGSEPFSPSSLPDAHIIESCTVTWYTEDTFGKTPDHPAYGITASGLPVEEHVTCAVDPEVIPLFSEVYVRYSDGSVKHFLATDTGVEGTWVDIYTPDYDYAVRCGLQTPTVYWREPEDMAEAADRMKGVAVDE